MNVGWGIQERGVHTKIIGQFCPLYPTPAQSPSVIILWSEVFTRKLVPLIDSENSLTSEIQNLLKMYNQKSSCEPWTPGQGRLQPIGKPADWGTRKHAGIKTGILVLLQMDLIPEITDGLNSKNDAFYLKKNPVNLISIEIRHYCPLRSEQNVSVNIEHEIAVWYWATALKIHLRPLLCVVQPRHMRRWEAGGIKESSRVSVTCSEVQRSCSEPARVQSDTSNKMELIKT